MRRSARTDLCGGRSEMIVPTASLGVNDPFGAIVSSICDLLGLFRRSTLDGYAPCLISVTLATNKDCTVSNLR